MILNQSIKNIINHFFKKEFNFEEISKINNDHYYLKYKKNRIDIYKLNNIIYCNFMNKIFLSFHDSFYTSYSIKNEIQIIKSYEYFGNKINEIQYYEDKNFFVFMLKNNYDNKKIYSLLSKNKNNISVISEVINNKLSDFIILFKTDFLTKYNDLYSLFELLINHNFLELKELIQSNYCYELYNIIKLNNEHLQKENFYFPILSYSLILDHILLKDDIIIENFKKPQVNFLSTRIKKIT